jgi:hypothetical protein
MKGQLQRRKKWGRSLTERRRMRKEMELQMEVGSAVMAAEVIE